MMQLSIDALYFKVLLLITAVMALSVSTLSMMEKSGHVNTDIMELKTRKMPGHILAKRSPIKKLFTIPLTKAGLLVTKKGLLLTKLGLIG